MDRKIFQIIERIKQEEGVKKDADVAKLLEMTPTALYNHKSRGSIPYNEILAYCERKNYSKDWIIDGIEPKFRSTEGQMGELPGQYGIDIRSRKLLQKVIMAVERYLDSENLELEPDKKAELITILYEDLLKDESKEAELEETIARLARLAA